MGAGYAVAAAHPKHTQKKNVLTSKTLYRKTNVYGHKKRDYIRILLCVMLVIIGKHIIIYTN